MTKDGVGKQSKMSSGQASLDYITNMMTPEATPGPAEIVAESQALRKGQIARRAVLKCEDADYLGILGLSKEDEKNKDTVQGAVYDRGLAVHIIENSGDAQDAAKAWGSK